jgi:hypothetical protein
MKIILKSTHYDLEIDPTEIPDAVLGQLLEALRYGHPTGHDAVEEIVRNCRSNAPTRQGNSNLSQDNNGQLIKTGAR